MVSRKSIQSVNDGADIHDHRINPSQPCITHRWQVLSQQNQQQQPHQQRPQWRHQTNHGDCNNKSRIRSRYTLRVYSDRWRMTLLSRPFILGVVLLLVTCGTRDRRVDGPNFGCFVVQAGWIDPDTPEQHYTTQPLTTGDQREFQLVRASLVEIEREKLPMCVLKSKSIATRYSLFFISMIVCISHFYGLCCLDDRSFPMNLNKKVERL